MHFRFSATRASGGAGRKFPVDFMELGNLGGLAVLGMGILLGRQAALGEEKQEEVPFSLLLHALIPVMVLVAGLLVTRLLPASAWSLGHMVFVVERFDYALLRCFTIRAFGWSWQALLALVLH